MKCTCKYCNKDFTISEEEFNLVDRAEGADVDVEPDENISPYRMEVAINPFMYDGFGDTGNEITLFAEYFTEMCKECKASLLKALNITVSAWKKQHESI